MKRQIDLELRCYPREDREFLADAQRAVAECRETVRRAEQLLGAVEKKLRERYPHAHVQPRETIAAPTDSEPGLWYVYRDGGWAA